MEMGDIEHQDRAAMRARAGQKRKVRDHEGFLYCYSTAYCPSLKVLVSLFGVVSPDSRRCSLSTVVPSLGTKDQRLPGEKPEEYEDETGQDFTVVSCSVLIHLSSTANKTARPDHATVGTQSQTGPVRYG